VSVLVFVSGWRQAASGFRVAAGVWRSRIPPHAQREPSTDTNTSTDTLALRLRSPPNFPHRHVA